MVTATTSSLPQTQGVHACLSAVAFLCMHCALVHVCMHQHEQQCGRTFKVEHVQSMPWAEICWYFTDTNQQYRIGGNLTIVGEDHPDMDLRQACCLP